MNSMLNNNTDYSSIQARVELAHQVLLASKQGYLVAALYSCSTNTTGATCKKTAQAGSIVSKEASAGAAIVLTDLGKLLLADNRVCALLEKNSIDIIKSKTVASTAEAKNEKKKKDAYLSARVQRNKTEPCIYCKKGTKFEVSDTRVCHLKDCKIRAQVNGLCVKPLDDAAAAPAAVVAAAAVPTMTIEQQSALVTETNYLRAQLEALKEPAPEKQPKKKANKKNRTSDWATKWTFFS